MFLTCICCCIVLVFHFTFLWFPHSRVSLGDIPERRNQYPHRTYEQFEGAYQDHYRRSGSYQWYKFTRVNYHENHDKTRRYYKDSYHDHDYNRYDMEYPVACKQDTAPKPLNKTP